MLRLLWLQCETRRCSRRQAELSAFLARSAIETCITGLYWIYGDEDIERARAENAASFQRLLLPVADGDVIAPKLIRDVAATIGSPPGLPSLLDRAKLVDERSGRTNAESLYRRLYVPLSILVAHSSGMALLRHVDSKGGLTETPSSAWTIRAARHTADACMAALAAEMAFEAKRPSALLATYADIHSEKTLAPVALILGGSAFRNLRPRRIAAALRPLRKLRQYYWSKRASLDPYPERKEKIGHGLAAVLEALGGDSSPSEEAMVDHFAAELARSIDERRIENGPE